MSVVRVRVLGGALNGHVLWVEEGRPSLDVNVAAGAGVSKKLRYRIDGETAVFVEEFAGAVSPEPKR
jgi:hypothetical protein